MPRISNVKITESATSSWQNLTPGWGGLNLADLPFRMDDSQSPNMLNMCIVNRTLACRKGQEWISGILDNDILSVYEKLYKGKFVVHSSTKIYTKELDSESFEEIYDGVTEEIGMFYEFGGKLYFKNKGSYLQYDGTEVQPVEPYVPTVCINRKPDGSSYDPAEAYNLLTGKFTNSFNGDGSTKTYKLTDAVLSDELLTATVGTEEKVEGNGFAVERATGTVTFDTAPAEGQNNVEITACAIGDILSKDREKIMNCNIIISYGGANNSRLFLAGSGEGKYYFSDVLNPGYFPDNNYNMAFDGSEDVTGFGEQYDMLIGFTKSKTFGVSYSISEDGTAIFSQVTINPEIGCDCPRTIALVENRLTWVTSGRGPMLLVSTDIENEKNVVPIGRNINGNGERTGLLQEKDIQNAIAGDIDGKYWIAVNGNAYVWDYANYPYRYTGQLEKDAMKIAWFLFDNMITSGFIRNDDDCYLARERGLVKLNDSKKDFEDGIKKVYRTPMLDFGIINYLKNILKVWITTRADTNSKIRIKYITEVEPEGEIETEEINAYSFSWTKTSWSLMTWQIIKFAKTYRRKCKKKKVQRFAMEMSNESAGSDMNIAEIHIEYTVSKMIKEN